MIVPSPYAAQLESVPVRARSLAVHDRETRYWEYGDSAAATTIVVVHGFRGDHHGLEPIVAQLSGYRLICPDLPGFGESEALSSTHDIHGYAAWLRAFVAELHVTGRLVVLGHSFGSIVVAAALADQVPADDALIPEDVVLINPIAAPALSGPRGILTRLAVFYYWLASALPERVGFALLRNRVIVRVMSVTMAKTKDPALRRWIHNQHDRYFSAFSDRRVVLEAFTASVSNDVSEFAARIPGHTLLIAADKDDITPIAAQYRLAALFPDATLQIIHGVGHLVHYEAPAQAAELITDFLGAEEPA
ncbi:alpha/beta fold hydrolase [Rathayibacter soli]|uniref:alpha/beta fold hydrolase n=1 Tax=Rathayibacter soli TaxID=3144168 RepID=UPI0027E53600|nr:alpha/beta fold hydrolase [Glaciibacter superstes]